ncbi:single-stranded-DNA-specific exonuclease RecJ [Paenibacillus sp. SYP-B4298]|uniref:single-stranded-DNA-specific exonuclease RecJ n=1 Tax=Paenibacillus sp. SYP-B4298 TaxID=2996034 RepID=UPI0022DDE1F6|nr:single-stranded-DNA-specific exonuclease RecJ [Paenibacillus sp. SYP-B4298]
MIRPKTRWVLEAEEEREQALSSQLEQELALPPLVSRLLLRRGIANAEAARAFLHGGEELLHDPYLLKGMAAAVKRIEQARERGERIRIFGDYDADGISSTSLMIHLFHQLGLEFDYYIPHRQLEGYGLNLQAIDRAAEAGVKLIVTVDTGISAVEQIAYASSLHIDVVVTDHHEPPELLPEAAAIVNPKQEDCPYPFKGLAGAGVAFKLGQALLGRPPLEWAEIAALGTIADLMPLVGENRYIVRAGMKQLAQTGNLGLRALAEVAGIELAQMTSTQVAFGLAPRINASGRLAHADLAVQLLTTGNEEEALAAAVQLDELNKQRQQLVEEMVEQAQAQLESRYARQSAERSTSGKPLSEGAAPSLWKEPAVTVVAGEGWNVGVVGIVASKLIEKRYKPTLVLAIDAQTGICKGSARSIDGFDIYRALRECEHLLHHYGGHQAAAGMTLHRDQLPELEQRLSELAEQWVASEQWQRQTRIDAECKIAEADLEAISQLAMLEPFGAGNPKPRLLLRSVAVEEARTMGKEGRHLRLSLRQGGQRLEAVGFGEGPVAGRLSTGALADVVGELSINEWNGNRKPQLMLADLRVEQLQLFDYRNDRYPEETLEKLLKERSRIRGADAVVAVLLQGGHAYAETAAALETVASGPRVVPLSYGAVHEPLACNELVLLHCPPSAAELAASLGRLQGLEAVTVLYSMDRRHRAGFPGREHFGNVYQLLRSLPQQQLNSTELPELLSSRIGWSTETVAMMLAVFEELEFIRIESGAVAVHPSPRKRELSESAAYRSGCAAHEDNQVLFAPAQELSAWISARVGRC